MRDYSNAQQTRYILLALGAAGAIGIVGTLSVLFRMPWLFASLGPTVVIQCGSPNEKIARPWNVATSHLMALAVAFLAIYLTGAVNLPPLAENSVLTMDRVLAAAIAVGIGFFLEVMLDARHPPSASTALLIALGIAPATWRMAVTIVVGVLLVTVIGEVLRQISERSFVFAKG